MTEKQLRVTFQPQGRTVYVLPETNVLEAAGRAGVIINTPCGGQGTCGRCRVQMTAGACPPTETEREQLSEEELDAGWRLACQTRICGEAVASVPPSSLFGDQHQILTQARAGGTAEVRHALRKVFVQLVEPTLDDDAPDLARLEAELGPLQVDLSLLRQLPRRLRENSFSGTAVIAGDRLIDFQPGDTTDACYGVAFDIGTTTVVGALLDLTDGDELAVAAEMNRQTTYGDDILARIHHARSEENGVRELQAAALWAVGAIIDSLCDRSGIDPRDICELTFAGNTAMQHLLCGLDVSALGEIPFIPSHKRSLTVPAESFATAVHPRGSAYVFPVIGGFVGGDIVAGLLATQLERQDGPAVLIDVGTNGEIVLSHEGRLWATSTAAGPAFEGARISCGMRASRGAIEKVVFDDDVRLSVIGDVEPVGLCGSGLVDLVARMLDAGMIGANGRMLPPEELPSGLGEALRRRVRRRNGGTEFVLSDASADNPVALTERDVRELQLASGAIRAGVRLLCKRAGLTPADLRSVLIAGGFGSFIRRSNAQRIGLLPGEVDHSRIHYVGNTSLDGAKWALLSTDARRQAERIATSVRHVELSRDTEFQMVFAEAMMFPS